MSVCSLQCVVDHITDVSQSCQCQFFWSERIFIYRCSDQCLAHHFALHLASKKLWIILTNTCSAMDEGLIRFREWGRLGRFRDRYSYRSLKGIQTFSLYWNHFDFSPKINISGKLRQTATDPNKIWYTCTG